MKIKEIQKVLENHSQVTSVLYKDSVPPKLEIKVEGNVSKFMHDLQFEDKRVLGPNLFSVNYYLIRVVK